MSETFDGDWLALRESFDAAARSMELATRFAAALPERPVIMDLGAGAGSLFRWLAPIIGRDQAWLLVDADAGLLARAQVMTAEWGKRLGFEVQVRDGLTLRTPTGVWRIGVRIANIADIGTIGADAADGVVCSALLDLVSTRWIEGLVAEMRGPLLACMNVDGRDAFRPGHAGDAAVRVGFRRDQARDKGFGPSVGPRAEAAVRRAFAARGYAVTAMASEWRVPGAAVAMARALVRGHAAAASRWMPAARGTIAVWEHARLRQAVAGRLALRIGHRDLLALPGGEH